jgi:GT2 family glycosyltransferase
MHARRVPEAQIHAAAGHSGDTTNKRNYRHLRPEYLRDFIAGMEDYWSEVGKLTKAHLRYQRDTKIVDMGRARATRKSKNG